MARPDAWRGHGQHARPLGAARSRHVGRGAQERCRALIGRIGVQRPESWPAIEVAWTLGRPYWGQGYATEAARASMDWGFKNLPVPKLVSLIDPENVPSQNVAKRLGQTKGGPATLFAQGVPFPWTSGKSPATAGRQASRPLSCLVFLPRGRGRCSRLVRRSSKSEGGSERRGVRSGCRCSTLNPSWFSKIRASIGRIS